MKREMLGGKIHLARVTGIHLEYEGSVEVDLNLLDAAGIVPYERVHVYNVTTGARLDTYAIPGKRKSGTVALNGAAARLAARGDQVIIVNYVQLDDEELRTHKPAVVVVDEHNRPLKRLQHSIRRKP